MPAGGLGKEVRRTADNTGPFSELGPLARADTTLPDEEMLTVTVTLPFWRAALRAADAIRLRTFEP